MATSYFIKVLTVEQRKIEGDIQFTITADVQNKTTGETRQGVVTFWGTHLKQLNAAQKVLEIRKALAVKAFPDAPVATPSIPDGDVTL